MRKYILFLLAILTLLSTCCFTVSAEEPFTDVKDSHWYYNAVNYCYDKGLMSGMTPTSFRPTGTVSREMFVQTLANGIIPRSLLSSDQIHFNQQTYNVIAKMIADKINSLEYLN